MKCVYYELEQGDTYAGVMIHSSARPFTITLIVSVQNDVIGTYDVHYSAGIDGYDIEEECGEYDINSDPTGSNQFARAVEEYNRTCKKLNQVIGDQEMLVTYVNSRIEASYTYEQVQADNAKQATERVEIEQRF
jgi:hypothetical protein